MCWMSTVMYNNKSFRQQNYEITYKEVLFLSGSKNNLDI